MSTRRSKRAAAVLAFFAAGFVALSTAGPGSGTATITPSSSVVAGSGGTWSIEYTATEVLDNGTVRITIPSGWSAPQTSSSTSPGYLTVATNEPTGTPGLSIAGQIVTIAVDTLSVANTVTLVYGDDTGSSLGRATAATTVGTYTFLVESDPFGGSPSPIASSPALNVIAGAPASFDILPDDTTGVLAGSFVQLHIRVLDAFGNRTPVPSDRDVTLNATHGFYYNPADHVTPISSTIIASGTNSKRVDYRATAATPGSPHTLFVFTPNGSPSLGGVETIHIVAAAVSTSNSSISATTPVVANGSAQSTVVVTSRDAFGNRRPGDSVTIDATGFAVDTDPPLPTDAIGQTSGVVTNTTAEPVIVSAAIGGQAITATAPITFTAGPVSATESTVDATSPVTANGTSTSTITVTARDANGNPIAGQSVTLFVTPTANTTLNQPGGVTNSLGQVTGTLSATSVAPRTVTAQIGSTGVTDNAVVQFNAGAVASFLVQVDGSAVAGTVDPVTLTARDALGNVVTDYTGTVTLTSTSSGSNSVEWALGSGQGIISNVPGSNNGSYTFAVADLGVASIRIIDEKVETIQVTATAGGPTGTSGNLVVAHNNADKIELISGNAQSATVDTPVASPPTVRVVDAFNNPVPGAAVTFTAVGGGGTVDAIAGGGIDSTVVTASDGRIDCDVWRLGIVAGPGLNRLRARIAAGTITSVDFTATGTAGPGANLDIAPNSKSVTQGTFEVVMATLTDAFGNPKSGDRVDVVIKSGLNGTLAEDPVDPGVTTALNPQARWGNTDAAGRITVRWVAPGGAGLADVLDASSTTVAQGSVVDATYTTIASGATNLRITFVGPATKPAGQTFEFLVEAVDGNSNLDPTNTSTVTLTPEAGGNLTFSETDFGTTVTQVTLAGGQKTVYGRGTVTGDWDITVDGLGTDTDVVTITDAGVIDHYAVTTVPGVVAGVLFDVTVEAQDVHNNRVLGANNAITLEAYDDVANSPALSSLLDPNATLVAGSATVAETYTKAEPIRVRASAAGKEGFSGVVAVSAAPAHHIVKISGDGAGIVAGANQPVAVQVLDAFENPVAGELVTFVETDGGGSPSPPSVNTNGTGQASTTWTTGLVAGDNRFKATIKDENPIGLERVDYLVSTIPGPVASFVVTPASYALVAGSGVALNVTGFDANGNLVSNDDATPVQLTETGSAQFGAATGTLTLGQFNTTVVDTVAESFTITATRQGGGATGTSGTVTVGHAGAYRITKVSGDASGVTVGNAQPLEVLVRDRYNNPVPNALVTFATTGVINDGSFADTSGDPSDGIAQTDGTGHALVTFTTSLTAGANAVNAQILDGAPPSLERVSFTVNTVAGGIAYYTVQTDQTTVTAGLTRTVTVSAFDSNDNPVDDDVTQVDLSGSPGVGLVFGADPVTLTNGVAADITVRADLVQTYQVRANTVGDPGVFGVGAQVTVSPADPAGTITGTPVPAVITANGVSTTTITSSVIRDAFTNQVPAGTPINVSATNGGVVLSGSPKLVAANGRITFDLRSSTTQGTSVVTMTSQLGSATGTVNVTFAPPPAFVSSDVPSPQIVAPAQSVAFSVPVQNTSTTDANLTTATVFSFTDGTRTFTANLASATTIPGPGVQTLVFNAATVVSAFTPAYYAPIVTLVGTDEFGAPINTQTTLPALSVLVTSIQITSIVPNLLTVTQGQDTEVVVTVKNNGVQATDITDVDLVFTPGSGVFMVDDALEVPLTLAGGIEGTFHVPVHVDLNCPVGPYDIDAIVVGDIGGTPVTDNSVLPFSRPTWQVVTPANLSYVAGTLSPMTVSFGDAYAFRATIRNDGEGVVSLDSSVTRMSFTDGTRTYLVAPSQPYAIAELSQQQLVFKTRTVANAFTPGSYGVSFHLEGTESGAPFSRDVTSGGDVVVVQTPASAVSGSVVPDVVSKGSSVSFSVQVTNSGGAAVVLTPASTEFRFAAGAFTADLDPTGPTTLPPGSTTLAFLSTAVSQSITAGTYAGQLVLTGTENGNPYSQTLATETVTVENAPDIQILANASSQSPITADQARDFKVRMVVRNNGGAAVTFTDASIRFIQAGQDRSGQFVISTPAGFVLGGSTLNGGGAADTVIFDVSDNTGNAMTAPSMMTIQGFLEVEDVNTQQPIFAERELGDFLQVQSPAAINVLAVLPSRSTVTQNMGRDFMVRALVQNTGTSDVTLNLAEPATDVTFTPSAGWVVAPRNQLGNGGNVLAGGEIDTVLFDVTTSGSTTGLAQVGTNYTGTENNSGRVVAGGSSGSASIDVQVPGTIVVTSVLASRATITNQAGVAWTLTVNLQNTGQSDVNLNLGNAIGVTFQDATTPPPLVRPSVLVGGGTVLSGGETDQIVIAVVGSGTYSTPGVKNVGVNFTGTDINSNVAPPAGVGNTAVTVQLQPSLNVVAVIPVTVSRGSIVAFQVTIVNATTNGATATLNPLSTRLVFGSDAYNVNLDAASPVDVAANQQITLLFNSAQIVPAIPLGAQADAQLRFRFVENDTPRSEDEPMNTPPDRRITVQAAPALNITSVRASRQNVTVGQTLPAWHITMVVTNANGSDVDLDLSSAITRLQLNLLGSGANVTSEYTITPPTALFGGGEILSSGVTDSLIFDVTQAGNTSGNVIVSGFVGGIDVVSTLPVSDNTGDGGSGSFVLQTAGVLNVLSMTPQRPTATVNQAADYTIKMAVRNDGQAAVDLDLTAPTATAVSFSAPAGWTTNVQPTLSIGGDARLSGGETDTVVFNVTTTGSVAALQTISGNVVGTEANTGASRSDNTASGGTGNITVQSEASIDILSATPSRATLTDNAAQPWDLALVVENTGQSAARLVLPAGLAISVQSAPTATFDPVNFLEEGGVVLAGGATGTLLVHADASPDFVALGTRTIGVSLDAVELNSNRAFNRNEPTIGSVVAQSPPNLTVALVPNPTLVTQGTQAFLELDVTNPGANAATVDLDGGNTRVRFAGGSYSAVLQPVSPTQIGPDQTVRVQFEDKLVDPTIAAGSYDLTIDLVYTANDLDATEVEPVTNGVSVQVPGAFRITGIVTSQSSATAGQTTPWTATMSIINTGSSAIDLNLAATGTYLQFVVPGGGFDLGYTVVQPTELAGGGTQLGVGLTGQLVFTITQTGNTTGVIVISGRVEGTDGATATVFDDTFDGGRGSIAVVPASAVSVVATHTSQPRVTAGQATDWDVRVVVANTGGGSVNLDLASSNIGFDDGTGWVVTTPPVFLGGGNPLAGGGVDSLLFRVTDTSPVAGTPRIDASVPWQDVNTLATGTANTATSGFGSILVQTPVNIRVTTTASQSPNPAAVNVGQSFVVRVQVENVGAGHADARDVALTLTGAGSTVTPIPPITEVPSGQIVTRDFAIDAAGSTNPGETFTSVINSVTDENSGQSVTPQAPLDNTAVVAIQNPAFFDVTSVSPSQATVTRGQTTPWSVLVRLHNSGGADAVLAPPAASDLAFAIGGSNQVDYVVQPPSAFASGDPGWTLPGGRIDSLLYVVSVTGGTEGLLDVTVTVDGTDRNQPSLNVGDSGATSVLVQAPAGLAIVTTLPVGTFNHANANRDTVNTNFAYQIHVTVDNTGEAVDSVLVQLSKDGPSTVLPASLRRQQIDVDGSHTFVFNVTASANPVPLETFTASILSGVQSHNSGQPVTPQPPVDNLHVVVTERPADLVMNLTSASGAVSTNQVFTISARVTNTGQAAVEGPAALTLTLPLGFIHLNPGTEPLVRPFVVGTPVTWQMQAPGSAQASQNFSATISTVPNDRNIDAATAMSQPTDAFGVAVVSGGAFTSPVIAIATPAGAVDGTVSATQHFFLDASVAATQTTNSIVATLSVPVGYQIVGAPTRNLGAGTGSSVSINPDFEVIAPAGAGVGALFVTFTGIDENTLQPVPTAADTVTVTTVPRAALTASALVTAPPEATDNSVTIGTTFTVTAQVDNAPSAAGLASPGTLTIALPGGYALAGGETAAKPFSIAVAVAWQVVAPPQPSGPQQINVALALPAPPDENSGQPALVLDGTASIAMVTEGSAVAVRDVSQSLGIDVGPVPAGTADVALLGFEIAYNVSDPSVADARIDTIAVTLVGDDGTALGPSTVAATLSRLSIDIGGAAPYEVADPSTNPVVVSFVAGPLSERTIAPDAARNATVAVSLDPNPRATEFSVGLRSGGLAVRDSQSGQSLGVTDSQGRPLNGVITSPLLVVLSSQFAEYVHNYPNPFRAGSQETRIAYIMQNTGTVNVQVYDLTGDLVFEESIPAGDPRTQSGPQETTWDGRNGKGEVVRNGIYVCVLNAGGQTAKFRIAVAK